MKKHVSRRPSLHLPVVLVLLLVLTFMQGCDSLSDTQLTNEHEPPIPFNDQLVYSPEDNLSQFQPDTTLTLDVPAEIINNSQEFSRFTTRIELEYGVIRRLLKRYGADIQILEANEVSRGNIHNHVNMNRLLKRYGITPQIITNNGDQITDALLSAHGVNDTILTMEGISDSDISQYNSFSTLLNTYSVTVEQFVGDQRSSTPQVRIQNLQNGPQPRLDIALTSDEIVDIRLEMSDDPDINDVD